MRVTFVGSKDIGSPSARCASAKIGSGQRPQRANVAQAEGNSGNFLFSVGGDASATKSSCVWLVDSGATQHITYSKEYMKNYKVIAPVDVYLADDGVIQAVDTGDIVMSMQTPRGIKKGRRINLGEAANRKQVLQQPGNVLDVGSITFEHDGCFAEAKVAAGSSVFVKAKGCSSSARHQSWRRGQCDRLDGVSWGHHGHLRLGHIGHGGLDAIVKKNYGVGIDIASVNSGRHVHSTPTFSGKRYFVTFIDDKSHFCVVYLLRNKSEVVTKFAKFVAFAETQTGKWIKTLRSDKGGEYTSHGMAKFCSRRGIVQKFTPSYTAQLNGVAGE
ncbi:unnamed protein product [Peronospora destructor]|uniref:Integrase catalytic domain-containing protein n=1 Tax=Peronospora destructor TaxID=86335 RepID=A0AAV0UR24_9STRA|nr:unnamed protein product [Peronospora destructor]